MKRATPASSSPAIPAISASKPEATPQWCVRRFPCVGKHSVMLRGFDGEGYPVYEWVFPLDEELERWERLMKNCIDARRAEHEARSPRLPMLRLEH